MLTCGGFGNCGTGRRPGIGRLLAYGSGMEFEWDEAGNSVSFERRGFGFA